MKINKTVVDRIVTLLSALAAAVLPILVDGDVLSSVIAADIGSGVAILVAAYHGGSVVTQRTMRTGGDADPDAPVAAPAQDAAQDSPLPLPMP
jgi:hypothetical protein